MISDDIFHRLQAAFTFLNHTEEQAAWELRQVAFPASLPAEKIVFSEGDQASALALLLSGVVRVYKTGRSGREITLYRFGAGDSCILTANAILNNQPFPANAIVEQAAEAVMIPESFFRSWVERYPLWREFVFGLLSLRLISVLSLVDDVVFRRMDVRVATFLSQNSQLQNPIWVTHQDIADELGSSREVISRILEGFAAVGWLRSARGMIEVLDFDSLDSLAGM